jgi:cytoskeletal protein CcmA (bactofilin family)
MDRKTEKGFFTIIGEGAAAEGTVSAPHSIRIDGTFRGKLETAEMLTIGKHGIVEAEIKTRSAVIGGKVTGNLTAEERVEIEAHASLLGDIQARDLVINEGALFHGRCSMMKDHQKG